MTNEPDIFERKQERITIPHPYKDKVIWVQNTSENQVIGISREIAKSRFKRQIRQDFDERYKCPHELDKEEYLRRLSTDERRNLNYLLHHVFLDSFYRCVSSVAALAVGTVVYPYSYWREIDQIARVDLTKKPFAERRGEDIDIILCPELFPVLMQEHYKMIGQDLKKAGLPFELEEDKGENGTDYLSVPKKHVKKHGKIIRNKQMEYGRPRFKINFPKGRIIHLIADSTLAELKLVYERLGVLAGMNPAPFSVLFRHGDKYNRTTGKYGLEESIERVNAQGELFAF